MEGRLDEGGLATPWNFLGLPPEFSGWDRAQVALLPVPYDATASYRSGARSGPQAILAASREVELYDEELCQEPYRAGVHTLDPLEPHAGGPGEMIARVERRVGEILAAGKFPLMLGGDHAIMAGAVRAQAARFGELTVVQFDAHADLREEYQGTKWSHACVGRRVLETGARLVQLGVRSLSREETELITQSGLQTVFARELLDDRRAAERVLAGLSDPVYITFDVDVLDSATMPATGTPEPGGLGWPTALALLRGLFERHRVVGCDVVELAPVPGLEAPNFLVAKLVYKLIGYRFMGSCER